MANLQNVGGVFMLVGQTASSSEAVVKGNITVGSVSQASEPPAPETRPMPVPPSTPVTSGQPSPFSYAP